MNRKRRRVDDEARAHNARGDALGRCGRLEEAVAAFQAALGLNPAFADALYNLGNARQAQGKFHEAVASFRAALAQKSDFPQARYNLGNALRAAGQPEEAIASFRAALAQKADFPRAHNNLGTVLKERGRLDEAAASFRAAVALRPDIPEFHNNLGAALRDQGALDEAASCLRAALALRPGYPEAHNNLGSALRDQGFLDESIACHRRAIEFSRDFADAHFNLGMALLARGDFLEGFQEYEWRFRTAHMAKSGRDFSAIPQWRGETAPGKFLLIHAEQGFGDTIQFCRYATLAVARGFRVILEVQKPLVRLLDDSLDGVERVIAQGDFLGDTRIDLHCPMLSLPLAFATTLETIPAREKPYLRANPARATEWNTRLAGGSEKRVGLVWAGAGAQAMDRRRSIAPEFLAPLFDVPGIIFVSLQKDFRAAPERFPLIDVMTEMENFADTAALVMTLDLVISVDTAVAHLAAALGKPVWLLDRFDHCWRWLAGRRDSPWYPTLRIHRQKRHGDWESVVAEITHDLKNLAT